MATSDVMVRVAGEGGEGVISVAEILTRSAANTNYRILTFRSYPAEIKGGLAMMQVRINTEAIGSIEMDADILMAFNQEALDVWGQRITGRGAVLYDPKHCEIPEDFPHKTIPVTLHDTAMAETGGRLSKNIVALAALIKALGIPPEAAKDLITKKFKRKGEEVLDKNMKAFDAGYNLLNGNADLAVLELDAPRTETAKRMIISGNQATAMGAIAAGCNYVAGYPITPATPVLEFMMKFLPSFGGNVVQAEDEIAALASCLGASYTGAKAMTATSGPGICLMSELISLSSISELPVVIVDVQRSGPGTGMPTKTEQADLMYALHGTAGEAPRIVIAPTTIKDCFYQMINAFNLAETYQMPVLVLTDQAMAYRTKSVLLPDMNRYPVVSRQTFADEAPEDYHRFLDTDTGISPTSIPGMPGGTFVATGLEHDEKGAPSYTPENRNKMMAKRYRKLETLEKELNANGNGICDDVEGAEIGVIGWGSTEGPIKEAIAMLNEQGAKVAHFHPKVLMPLQTEKVENFLKPLKKVIVVEENHTKQFAQYLRGTVHLNGTEIAEVNKCTGLPFSGLEVHAALQEHI